jgi:predicted nucleic acid-binding protein
MAALFGDTSGWGHLADSSQRFHSLARQTYRTLRLSDTIVTTSYVIAELVALLTSPLRVPRPLLVAFIDGLKNSPYVEIVHVDQQLDDDAWRLLKNRQDKEWSLVDCVSFVVMQRRGITESLTTDHHFEQAGFVRLLK